MNRTILTIVAALVGLALVTSGCIVALAAGAAAGAGTYVWASGKLSFSTPHSIGECHNATISAFRDLDIKVVSDETDRLSGRIRGETSTGESVAVDLEPQPPTNTWIEIRVGFWGNRAKSAKVADAIKRHLL